LKNGLGEKRDQSIAAGLRRAFDFSDVLVITSTGNEVWAEFGDGWLEDDVPAGATECVDDDAL
jgi:hypothetical protein